ncbi:undecaprenyl phosphate translocase family protein [Solicola sp. PLA-1-18]|uniref:undecaprenyl phosphate translocase family protein n=1 Tax=Solicola sp. PLA-1-18 TaxID=3380532 RepID=UPI003B7D3FE9
MADRAASARGVTATLGRGFAMGAVEAVPGVSAATVALVLGSYDRLLQAAGDLGGGAGLLVRGRPGEAGHRWAAVPWAWLATVAAGAVAAVLLVVPLLRSLLAGHPQPMAGLFLGFVLAASLLVWRQVGGHDPLHLLLAVAAAAALFVLLGVAAPSSGAPVSWWWLTAGGALAACAALLPGVSGSLVLVAVGLYADVLTALAERDLSVLGPLAAGVVVGGAVFAGLVLRLLHRHHDVVLAVLVGLMLGSTRVLWPWPHGTQDTVLGPPTSVAPWVAATAGVVLVVLLTRGLPRTPHAADGAAR